MVCAAIRPTGLGARTPLVTVTCARWVTSRLSGSVAVRVSVVLPSDTPVRVSDVRKIEARAILASAVPPA